MESAAAVDILRLKGVLMTCVEKGMLVNHRDYLSLRFHYYHSFAETLVRPSTRRL